MPKIAGIKKRKLTPGAPKARRASSVKAPVETLPHAPADVVVESAPATTGGSPAGALPRSRRKTPAHIQAALDRALATSEGKEAPPVDTTGVDPALVREFAERPEAAEAPGPAPAAPADPVERVLARYPIAAGGRPTLYRPEYCEIVRQYYEHGADDYQVAELLEVSTRTLCRWRAEHIEFRLASVLGEQAQDAEVQRSFFHNAKGYTRRVEKVMSFQGNPFIVEHYEEVAGDVGAQKHWLANRKRGEWSNDPDQKPTDPLATVGAMTLVELARRMGTLLVAGMKAEATIIEAHDDGPAA